MRGALFIFLMLFTAQSFASVIIPNYYRNRRVMNVGPAIGWSARREVGIIYSQLESENRTNGVKADDTDATLLTPYLFHRAGQNMTFELQYEAADAEEKAPASPADTNKAKTIAAGFGYEMTGVPMELGFQTSYTQYEEKDGTTGVKTVDSDANSYGLHAGYRMASDIYLGAAWFHTDIESGDPDITIDQGIAGMGQVFGDRANPSAAYEIFVSYLNQESVQDTDVTFDGVLNSGNVQYRARLEIGQLQGQNKGTDFIFALGMDYLFPAGIYLSPLVTRSRGDLDTGSAKTETESMDLSFQAGYRNETLEAALTYTLSQSEERQSSPTVSKDESEGSTMSVHVSYFF